MTATGEGAAVVASDRTVSGPYAAMTHMDGGELQMVREYLGLTGESLAGMLSVNPRTVRSWEAGKERIPERIREEVELIEAYTAAAVGELVAALHDDSDPVVLVYRSDLEFHAVHRAYGHLSARWWRMVVARACHEVPGVVVRTALPSG